MWRASLPSRGARPCSAPATTTPPSPPPPDATAAQFASLAAALADPTTLSVAAGLTPLGRGLLATRPAAPGATLLSVDVCCALGVATHAPAAPGGFARSALADWQAVHGPLPPLLVRYVLAGSDNWFARLVAWQAWATACGPPAWRAYGVLMPQVGWSAEGGGGLEWKAGSECVCRRAGSARSARLPSAPTPPSRFPTHFPTALQLDDLSLLMCFTPSEASTLLPPHLASLAATERATVLGLHSRLFASEGGELAALKVAADEGATLVAAARVASRSFDERARFTTPAGGGAVRLRRLRLGVVVGWVRAGGGGRAAAQGRGRPRPPRSQPHLSNPPADGGGVVRRAAGRHGQPRPPGPRRRFWAGPGRRRLPPDRPALAGARRRGHHLLHGRPARAQAV